jgi:lipopolysaccharide heptosyltransferase II
MGGVGVFNRGTCAARLRRRPLGRYRYTRWRWRLVFAVVDFVGTVVFRGLRAMRGSLRWAVIGQRSSEETLCDDPRVILVVQLDHLGDAVISTVMFPALRQRYPRASIEVLVGEWNKTLFEAIPEVDRVHVSRVNRFTRGRRFGWLLATLWWGWKLRHRKVDLAIDVRGEFPLAVLLWLSGARRRVGWACGGGGFLLTDSPLYVPHRPEVESRLALLEQLGIRPESGERWLPEFHPSEAAWQQARQWWEYVEAKSPSTGPRVVVHVGAGTAAKRWPAEHWRELIGWMTARFQAQLVLVGSTTDRIIARHILGPQSCDGVVDWTGRLSLVELAAVLEQADLFIGADSGPAHLAAAVGVPVVALFSGTNRPRQWQPVGRQVCVVRHRAPCSPCHREQCPLASHPCMAELRPRQVAEVVEPLISAFRRKGVQQ